MTCTDCGDKPQKPACGFPKAVIEIDNPEQINLFRKVVIPVSMGDDKNVPPTIGKYRNVLLVYEANNHAYLYSSDGIPTLLTPDVAQDLENKIDAVADELQTEITNRENVDIALDNRLTTVEDIATTALQPSAIDKVVMTDISLNPNTSTTTVQIDGAKENLLTGATTTKNIPLPVASHTEAGVMNSSTFDAVTNNSNNINALLNGAVAITGLSANPSQSDLTTAWETQTGLATLMNRASIYDVTNNKVWTYYSNDSTWYVASNTAQVTINTFTNSSEGTILGSTNVGQIFAENDGTGSVNGWDALSGNVSTNTSNITSLQTSVASKQDKLTAGANITISPTNVISATGTEYTAGNGIMIDTSDNNRIDAAIYPEDFFTASKIIEDKGSNFIISNTLPTKIDTIQLEGNTEQNGTPTPSTPITVQVVAGEQTVKVTGKNLYEGSQDFSGVWGNSGAWSTDESLYNGLVVKKKNEAWNGLYKEIEVEVGKTYTFSYYAKADSSRNVVVYTSGGQVTTTPVNKTQAITTEWERYSFTFTPNATGTVRCRVENMETQTTPTYVCGYQLEVAGSMSEYEPYQEQNYYLNLGGKNLFNSTIEQGTIAGATGANQAANNRVRTAGYTTVQPQTTYTVSANAGSTLGTVIAFCYKEDGTYIDRTTTAFQSCPYTFTTLANTAKIRLAFARDSQGNLTPSDLSKVQLEEGSSLGPYAPYTTQVVELCKIGDYQDYIYKSGDNWYVHKEIGMVDLATLTWSTVSGTIKGTTGITDIKYVPNNTVVGDGLAEKYGVRQGQGLSNNVNYLAIDTARVNVNIGTGSDPTGLFYYALATPTDTQITDTGLVEELEILSQARTYLDTTHFLTTTIGANLPVILNIKAAKKSLDGVISLIKEPVRNLIVELPNGITTYPVGSAPIAFDEALEAFEEGRSIFFVSYGDAKKDIYVVSAIESNDGSWSMKVERVGTSVSRDAGHWVISSGNATQWEYVDFYPNISITMSSTDPGEGQPLLPNNFIAYYE